MILTDRYIDNCFAGKFKRGSITPFDPACINPASYDVKLHPDIIVDPERWNHVKKLPYDLKPGEFILASTYEHFIFPDDIAGDLRLKSSMGRLGLSHVLSVWFDPGFNGQGTLELYNVSQVPITLNPMQRIAQMVFIQCTGPAKQAYKGRYQHQQGPTLSRIDRENSKGKGI